MNHKLFIADLHLDAAHPVLLRLFVDFLAHRATQAEALYILGDLFEVWVGDDDDAPVCQAVKDALRMLSAQKIPIFIMHGNRDFLLGNDFFADSGCQCLPDPAVIDLYGVPTLVMHGDTLCTADTGYQEFRRQMRNPVWQQAFLSKPLAERRAIAQSLRAQSMAHTQAKSEDIMDAAPEAISEALKKHSVLQLIHGHTHRPGIHAIQLNGHTAKRIVLGDWYAKGNMLVCTPEACQLQSIS
ncbi:MAG: UDP-2,3-diacylglucosamine diphosphatase [Gammaproteobacteria bacterium]|nr:UDP-2,3-diacylglucosamine diphosphatase [Gammaproteobacteria bacterium]